MMILTIILIAGAIYMYKETRLTFVRWVSDSHQIGDAHVGKFEERNVKALKRKFCYPNVKFGASLFGHSLFRFSLLSSLLKLQLQPCRVVDNSLNILNERFARGEISEDEYVRTRSALNNK